MKKSATFLLIVFSLVSLFFNLYKKSQSPPGFTADEAAFSYNAYSLMKTGKDEYGAKFPLRLKSFGDYKMPVFTYLSIPFIKAMGLNENSARALNTLLALLFPVVVFLLAKELFAKVEVGLIAALITSVTLGLHIVGRQAHEAYLAVFLITLTAFFFLKELKNNSLLISPLLLLIALFAYQSSRIFAFFFLGFALFYFWKKKISKFLLGGFLVALLLFTTTDFIYKPERVKNLLYFNNPGFVLKINELRGEGGPRIFYNKLTVGARDLVLEYSKYFSPQFLITQGDENPRFGFPGMSLVSPLIYLSLFVGIYYLFKNKQKRRYFILGLLLVSPIAAFLTWAGISLTRSLFILVPTIVIASYGIYHFLDLFKQRKVLAATALVIIEIFFLFYSWDFYLNHYPKRALIVRSMEAGYKELGDYIQNNYERFDNFYITKQHGQPYIHLLFQLGYPPEKFQMQAVLSAPDEYGFGTVEKFDKFNFNFRFDSKLIKTAFIGYPEDFGRTQLDPAKLKIIRVQNEEIFWIFENN